MTGHDQTRPGASRAEPRKPAMPSSAVKASATVDQEDGSDAIVTVKGIRLRGKGRSPGLVMMIENVNQVLDCLCILRLRQ